MKPAFLVMNKPPGVTSHDVVAAVRAVSGIKKVGHTGTLDPFAVGVLPLALGPATKLIQFLDEALKVYQATISFGMKTDTGDPTGTSIAQAPPPEKDADVRAVLDTFLGERDQVPPRYSAVKVKGKALYKYAREGKEVEAKARRISVHEIELLGYTGETMEVVLHCSRGTYARVLAEEIAEALGSVGHLSALVRLRSGPFGIDQALSIEELADIVAQQPGQDWQKVLLSRGRGEDRVPWRHRDEVREALGAHVIEPLAALSHLPLQEVSRPDADRLRRGSGFVPPPTGFGSGRFLVVCGPELLGIAEAQGGAGKMLRLV